MTDSTTINTIAAPATDEIIKYHTFRIPRGLWRDLEETVIQQDRQFLSEVARTLGLPVQDVLRRCLGTGAPTTIPVLWMPTVAAGRCPWWERHGEGLLRPCPRLRLSPTMPCQIHERCTPCPLTRLDNDPFIRALPTFEPFTFNGNLYWLDPKGDGALYREDGTLETEGEIRFINFRDTRIPVWVSHTTKPTTEEESDDE
jgi:hypothetical protein